MIKFEHTLVFGWDAAFRGMRNSYNSWDRSDTLLDKNHQIIGPIGDKDLELAQKLADLGPVHGKFLRMIDVTVDITAPLYWWKEFDTYKVGTVSNSCSTMHTIHKKEFELDDFSHEHLDDDINQSDFIDEIGTVTTPVECLKITIFMLNYYRELYLKTKDKKYWWQIIQLLPDSYNQKRTIQMNYAVLQNIFEYRKDHKLDEWVTFCAWIVKLPYSRLITGGKK